jgi:uncharacterized protein (DUF488 family)
MYPPILSIGHSTRTFAVFIALLEENGAEWIADVRSIPRSRHNPQFNQEILRESLSAQGIGYLHLSGLGCFRKPKPDSLNTAWKNKSFRGYADYMHTAQFQQSLEILIGLAQTKRVAVMCAEAVPWRCHRSLIADALFVQEIRVTHIIRHGENIVHVLTPTARVEHGVISYP